ncbi:DEAD/DEAH box helicase [Lysobacter sp. Hz 25]|uniref:DEAD/DEAH box helicase n=1 Tax=Lysobacter sp. Hz 25 TaxID=3383698 RepID=UPI0038D4A1F7
MALKWQGTLQLPPLPERKVTVGGNVVYQAPFAGATCQAAVHDADVPGHDLVLTDLRAPFDRLYLRRKSARRRAPEAGVLRSDEPTDASAWPDAVDHLSWDKGALDDWASTPEAVVRSWQGQFAFRAQQSDPPARGLRSPQLGALHAIAGHFAVGKEFEPATVVLPTGAGKTETMLAVQVYRQVTRSLVLVPSEVLRVQIGRKFLSLGVLQQAEVVPWEVACPRVALLRKGIATAEEARALAAESNVIVALPNSLAACTPEAADALSEACTDLIVDEAHHVSAKSWDTVRQRFSSKRVLQFTATPFRQDGKRVGGKIIFNYKLGDAQDDGLYSPINLRTVEEYGDQTARDRAIADAAIAALRDDLAQGRDHRLLARAHTRQRAEALGVLYRQLAPELNPVVVYSGPGRRQANAEALAALRAGGPAGTRVIVCVDMLGEGFDYANLKVAALHDVHKSLAITLQFIGRFTRTDAGQPLGEATAVANIADQELETKLARLYAEGADWDRIIRRLSEERIATEVRLQQVVQGLREEGDLAARLSLWNLRPAFSTQFYRTQCATWAPTEYKAALPPRAKSWYAFNEDEGVLVAVVCRDAEVNWGNYQDVQDTVYDLLVMRWDQAQGVLCVYASDYTALRAEQVAVAVTDDRTTLVTGDPIFRILNNVELPLAKSLGSSRAGAISFTSYFGPNVTDGLADIEKAEAELNNIACLGYEEGERVIWGGTKRRGKIWQVRHGPVSEWMAWTARAWSKVAHGGAEEANIVRGFLRPTKMAGAYASPPIAVQWGEQAQVQSFERQTLLFDNLEVPLALVGLDIAEFSDDGAIVIRFSTDGAASEYRQTISPELQNGYVHAWVSGPRLQFKRGRAAAVDLEDLLVRDPLVVRYADGSYSYNCYHIATQINAGVFDRDRLEGWDWTGIPLNRESMHRERHRDTIQYRVYERLQAEFDVVINDDGHGEAADLVCFKDVDEGSVKLCLVHCKGAHRGVVSQDIRNFYTVCGQAQKNITARHKGIGQLYLDLKRRHETWAREGASRFLKGDVGLLSALKEKSRRAQLLFEIVLVQPGASVQTITDDCLRLLATTELFLRKTTEAQFRVILSP